MKSVQSILVLAAALLLSSGCTSSRTPEAASPRAQQQQATGTTTEVRVALAGSTATPQKQQARRQLRRLLSGYDLDPWIFTQDVQIETGVDAHSHPVLTLNTEFLGSDEAQLSVFLHEQMHWFVGRSVSPFPPESGEEKAAVIEDLQALYPEPPAAAEYGTFVHLIVGWLELDAVAELLGEAQARRVGEEVVQQTAQGPPSSTKESYLWYRSRVSEDTEEIGAILADHGLVITPEKGLAVGGSR